MWHLNAVSSQKLLQSSKALKNNAVIPLEPDGVIDSEECRLKLSPSQSGSTQGQGKRSSEGQISRSSDVLIIDTLSVTSHTETTTVAKMVKSASQGASIGYAGSACLINDRRSSSAPRSVEEIRSSRKRQKELLAISSNPLVIWKNEDSDIGKFHLETPRDSHMTDTPVSQGAVSIATSDAALTAEHVPVLRSETRDVVAGDPIISMPACATVDKLSISMIQSESESTTQPMFRLERPIMEESEDIIEEVVVARKPMSANRRRRVIEDDSDEDIKTDQTISGYHHATNEQLNNTLEQEETFNLSSGQYLATKIGPTDNVEAMADETQNYVVNEQDCCLNDLKTSLGEGIDTAYNELTQRDNVVSEAKNDENIGESEKRVTESATQTTENKPCVPFEDVDMNIVQKVTEYLTGTYQRSGSNSTCTDLSDLHADGSEKGESGLKSPQLTTPGKSGTLKSRSRRESTEQRSPKSPHEIQTIIQTYSNILQKSVKKQQERKDSVLASSQTFTNQGEFVERSSIPRRLSTQSLPEHLLRPGSSYVSLQQHSHYLPAPYRRVDVTQETHDSDVQSKGKWGNKTWLQTI
ncbi:uncharacterized protein LOC127877445 isoform X1 [Dreissena polymorpha]|nr:uncharacterized protein LOC127877445 isoform X1 [Dreissena polymorpha]